MYFVTIFTVLSDTLISLQCRSNVTQGIQASSQKNNDHHSKVRKFLQLLTIFCQRFFKISNVTVFNFPIPSRDVNLARDMQGFSETMPQKDLDMRMIKASAYNCSCWRRILPTCRCDLTAHLSLQWIQHQLINNSNPFP